MSSTPPAVPQGDDASRLCPHGFPTRGGRPECCNLERGLSGSPGSDLASSQSLVSEITSSDTATESPHRESPGSDLASSQGLVSDITSSDTATESQPKESPHDDNATGNVPAGKRARTKRGRSGKKWVGLNWEHKEQLKAQNNGIMPHSEALVTSAFPHSDEWSVENLPEILFYIKPPKSEYEGKPVGLVMEGDQVVTVGDSQKPLREFEILPRRISIEVPGWLIETWRRIDPRITYPDILDRQVDDQVLGLKKLDKNALQNHCRRECRMILGLWTSYDRRAVPHRADVEAIETLSHQNIMLNTILNVNPVRQDRLTKIRMVRGGVDHCGKYYAKACEVDGKNWHETTFHLDHFVLKGGLPAESLHQMDDSMLAAWELSLILQERARIHGVSHWKNLADGCRPVSWFDRTVNKRVDNDTFDRGCSVCTWNPKRDQQAHKSWVQGIRFACDRSFKRKAARKGSKATTSKRKKKNDGQSQDASTETAADSDNECDCCKQVGSSQTSAVSKEQYPSERFRRGEIHSFFRSPDVVENGNERKTKVKNGEHSVESEPSGDQGSQRSLSNEISSSLTDTGSPRMPVEKSAIDPTLSAHSAEKILPEIGSHLGMLEREFPSLEGENEAATTDWREEDHLLDPWMPPFRDLPEGFSGDLIPEGDGALQRHVMIGSSLDAQDNSSTPEGPVEASRDDAPWDTLFGQYGTDFIAPYDQEYVPGYGWPIPQGGLDHGSTQDYNDLLPGLPQPSSFHDQPIISEMESGMWSSSPPLLPLESVPVLAPGFPTEMGSLASEIPGSNIFAGGNHGNYIMADESVNTFQMNAAGLSTVNDPNFPSDWKGKEAMTGPVSGFNMETYFDTESFQERLETSDPTIAPNPPEEVHYEGYDDTNTIPALEPQYYHYANAGRQSSVEQFSSFY